MANTLKIVKQKEAYVIYNTTNFPGSYIITKKNCSGIEELVESGNFRSRVSDSSMSNHYEYYLEFTPTTNGDFYITASFGEEDQTLIISHYPLLISSIVRDVEKLLCNDDDCGCGGKVDDDCISKEARACLEYQALFANINLLMGIFKGLDCSYSNVNILTTYASFLIQKYQCEFNTMFCESQVGLKLTGKFQSNNKLIKKLLGIYYLTLYFYEKELTSKETDYVTFLDNKYNYKTLKDCLLKTGIDILLMETAFTEIYYEHCSTPEPVCDLSCFVPTTAGVEKSYDFNVNEQVDGIYDTVSFKNTCTSAQIFVNRIIYQDEDFKVVAKLQSSSTYIDVQPGGIVTLNVIFTGTKPVYSVLTVPFNYEGVNANIYKIRFLEEIVVPNTAPVISDIVKSLNNRTPYTFTVADFENHFSDADGDTMGKIVLVGDTSRYTLDDIPYVSGTVITRDNITNLTYTPLDTDTYYEVIVHWKAFDSRGLESN